MKTSFCVTINGCVVSGECVYAPGRPAPYCKDHDAAAFSDPGCFDECEITEVRIEGPIPFVALDDNWLDKLQDAIIERERTDAQSP